MIRSTFKRKMHSQEIGTVYFLDSHINIYTGGRTVVGFDFRMLLSRMTTNNKQTI